MTRMRLLYAERRNVLMESIRKYLGFAANIIGEQAGMHLCVTVRGINDREIAERAAGQHLWLLPLSSSYLRKPAFHGFILGFGSTKAEEIPTCVRKLAALLKTN